MSDVKELKAVARDRVGKGAAREVRRQGQVPAVIYGGGAAPQAISLDFNETRQRYLAGRFLSTVFEIEVGGRKTRVIPRDIQLDVVKDTPLHVDFLRVAAGQELRVEVPVHVTGQDDSPGVKRGGTVQVVRHTLELMVPADRIPESIEVSIASLDIGSTIHISEVALPNGVRPAFPEDRTVVTLVAPTVLAEEEAETPAEGAAEDSEG